jgi:hypothetical protein
MIRVRTPAWLLGQSWPLFSRGRRLEARVDSEVFVVMKSYSNMLLKSCLGNNEAMLIVIGKMQHRVSEPERPLSYII